MSAKTPQEIARAAAGKSLMALADHYARTGIEGIRQPLPPELEMQGEELRALDGLSVLKLVVARQQFLRFSDR